MHGSEGGRRKSAGIEPITRRRPTLLFDTGRVCVGTHPFPADPARVPTAFFESYFSAHPGTARGKSRRHPEDVGRLWDELDGAREFPLDDLLPHSTVAEAMRLGTGEARR